MIDKLLFIVDDHEDRQKTNYKPFIDMAKINAERVKLIHHTNETSIAELVTNAVCVCIHESMPNGIDRNGHGFDFGKLRRELKNNSIPSVFFSNSANQLTVLNLPSVLTMKSDDFYMNLPYFVQVFQERGVIDLELLALGQNYDREKIVRLKNEMLTYFDGFERDEPISMSIEDRTVFRTLLEQFGELAKEPLADNTFRSLNGKRLTKLSFEQTLYSIIKFIR